MIYWRIRFCKDWFKEGEAKGEAKGEARGEARGKAKGRAEEAVRLVTKILERRFGSLPEWAQEKIRITPVEKLEGSLGQLLDAQTLEEAMNF